MSLIGTLQKLFGYLKGPILLKSLVTKSSPFHIVKCLAQLLFFAAFPIRALTSDVVCQMERLGFIFPATLYHCAGSQTHVTSGSRLARSTH